QTTPAVLTYLLSKIMKIVHPFIPFLTQTISQTLPHHPQTILKPNCPTLHQALIFNQTKQTIQQLLQIIKSLPQSTLQLNTPLSNPIPI
ncbi:class I tRNA ligase family protein, partial [Staphylococcus epidermidis]|uniref:class I tRNA ligase family protein n=1 Tax=Staphylococcus epidermidis TaxID=1282 RepID=UPI00119D49B8